MSFTYVCVVLVLAATLVLLMVRRRLFGGLTAGEEHNWFRDGIVGLSRQRGNDVVERLACCLADATVVLGSSYAVPGFLAIVLPAGLFRAASATKPQLVAEVLDRYAELMSDRARREGRRHDFHLPPGYILRVALACGPAERCMASFEPIGDVHAALGLPTTGQDAVNAAGYGDPDGRTSALLPVGRPAGEGIDAVVTKRRPLPCEETVRRVPLTDPADEVIEFVLSVDGSAVAHCRLGDGRSGVVVIGRGANADLRCPNSVHEVSRQHAELTYVEGRVWIEDKHSANGTWLQRHDGATERLSPGQLCPVEWDDTIWLDSDHRTTVVAIGGEKS